MDLTSVTEGVLVPSAFATALSVKEEPGVALPVTLTRALADKSLLAVVDNCEHLIEVVARLVETLLHSCRGLRVLATSRESLEIAGEESYQVSPFPVPNASVESVDPTVCQQWEAVQLFAQRAREASPSFRIDKSSAPLVVQICRRLDGIPLAIELAAARLQVLDLDRICRGLDDCFRFLRSKTRTALPGHQTLEAAISWSYELLTDEERVLLRRLSVFQGGWSLEACESVGSGESVEPWDVLDLLSNLVSKSMVVVEPGSETITGQPRFKMLETIRFFSTIRLEEEEEVYEVRRLHSNYYLQLVEGIDPNFQGPDQKRWHDLLEVEHENILSAIDWLHRVEGDVEKALRIAVVTSWLWSVRCHFGTGRDVFTRLLADPRAAPSPWRARALGSMAGFERVRGNLTQAKQLLEESLEVSKAVGYPRGTANAFFHLGMLARRAGDFDEAARMLEGALEIGREIENHHICANALNDLGNVAFSRGDRIQARHWYERSLEAQQLAKDQKGVAVTKSNLADIDRLDGKLDQARIRYEESLQTCREIGDRRLIIGMSFGLASIALEQGDLGTAGSLYAEGLRRNEALEQPRYLAYGLEGLGYLALVEEKHRRAARLFGAVESVLATAGLQVGEYDIAEFRTRISDSRAALGELEFESERMAGRQMSPEDVLSFALST